MQEGQAEAEAEVPSAAKFGGEVVGGTGGIVEVVVGIVEVA